MDPDPDPHLSKKLDPDSNPHLPKRLQKVLYKICFSAKTKSAVELAFYFSFAISSYIRIVEDMVIYLLRVRLLC